MQRRLNADEVGGDGLVDVLLARNLAGPSPDGARVDFASSAHLRGGGPLGLEPCSCCGKVNVGVALVAFACGAEVKSVEHSEIKLMKGAVCEVVLVVLRRAGEKSLA